MCVCVRACVCVRVRVVGDQRKLTFRLHDISCGGFLKIIV